MLSRLQRLARCGHLQAFVYVAQFADEDSERGWCQPVGTDLGQTIGSIEILKGYILKIAMEQGK